MGAGVPRGLAPVRAARGGPASGSGSRPSRRPCARSPTRASTAYYDGALGERIAAGLGRAGGVHSVEDLRATASTWETPIATTYRGVRVTTHPPNSSGMVALEILNVLARFEPPPGARFTGRGWSDPAWIHLVLEAGKLALVDRDAHLADPGFRDVPVDRLLSPDRAAELAARIDPRRADPSPPPVRTLVGGTIWLGVVDAEGNAVSLIQSNAAGFGSGVLDPVTGVHFQNRGASFSLDPTHANALEPGRRTAHSLLPGMLFREGERRPWVVAGSMGGDNQPQIHAQLVSALVDGATDIATAVAAPRVVVHPDGWLAPPVDVLADGELAGGVEDGLRAAGSPPATGRASTAAWATSTRSSWWTAGRPPGDRSPRPRTPDPPGCRPSAEHGSGRAGWYPPAAGGSRAHTRPAAGLVCGAEGAVTSNVGQNYPYTSETDAERVATVATLVQEREGLADKLTGRDHAARPERSLVGMEVPDLRLRRPAPRRRLRVREARRLHRLRRHLREDVPALTAGRDA